MAKPRVLTPGASSYLAHLLVPPASDYTEVFGISRAVNAVVPPATPVAFDLFGCERVEHIVDDIRPGVIIDAAAVNPGDGEH